MTGRRIGIAWIIIAETSAVAVEAVWIAKISAVAVEVVWIIIAETSAVAAEAVWVIIAETSAVAAEAFWVAKTVSSTKKQNFGANIFSEAWIQNKELEQLLHTRIACREAFRLANQVSRPHAPTNSRVLLSLLHYLQGRDRQVHIQVHNIDMVREVRMYSREIRLAKH